MFPILQVCAGKQTELEIGLPEDLAIFAHAVNHGDLSGRSDLAVRLTADLDMTEFRWVPIGNEDIPFYGTFDGGGHSISGLHIDKREGICCGLFGVCAGTVENLTVTGSITCVAADVHSAVGGIAGLVVGGHISNCTADLTIDSNRLTLGMYAGGVVGQITEGTIRGCRSSTRFENVLGNFLYLGGVAGAAEDSRVAHCIFDGSIQILGGVGYYIDAGGIVGNVQGHSTVSDCLNRGVMDANEYDFEFLTLGDIVGRWEGESVFLQSGRRDTLSGHRRTASSMTKEER